MASRKRANGATGGATRTFPGSCRSGRTGPAAWSRRSTTTSATSPSSSAIGLTLVGFGTSTPELVASLRAALIGSPGIAIGNIVGSNIANVLLILGLSAVVFPLATTKEAFRRDGAVLIGASMLLLAVVLLGAVGRGTGLVFLGLLAAYIADLAFRAPER